jgi:hypothetical protein
MADAPARKWAHALLESHRIVEGGAAMEGWKNGYVMSGLAILLIGSIGLGVYGLIGGISASSEIFRFISLLIIFMAALAAAATVFFGLSMGNGQEAFGLPTGSVRALLAMGIMILFVVFGLPLITTPKDGPTRLADQPLTTTSVPVAQLPAAISQHQQQDLVVVVQDYGRAAGTTGATDPGAPARINVYQKVRARPAEELEVARQMLTAIVTLLTTVVGFYFGSRTATERLRDIDAVVPVAPPAAH